MVWPDPLGVTDFLEQEVSLVHQAHSDHLEKTVTKATLACPVKKASRAAKETRVLQEPLDHREW